MRNGQCPQQPTGAILDIGCIVMLHISCLFTQITCDQNWKVISAKDIRRYTTQSHIQSGSIAGFQVAISDPHPEYMFVL